MNTLGIVNLVVCLSAIGIGISWPWLSAKVKSWRSGAVDPPDGLNDSEMDPDSKKLISAAKALLIARKRAEDNPRLKAKIEDALACLPDFVCTKGAA